MRRHRCVFGPVASRRLGRSLGIDLLPFKTCSYDCIYCQLGCTTRRTITRKEYVPLEGILEDVRRKLHNAPPPDYITLAGSGEPTLHSRMGELIGELKRLSSVPVAVLTNGSLLWSREVREDLREADLVIPSLDAGDEKLFRYVNRPQQEITFDRMVSGLSDFSAGFTGSVWLEVFLLDGVTGIAHEVRKIAAVAAQLRLRRIQLNTVARPPAKDFAMPVSRQRLADFAAAFSPYAEIVAEPPSFVTPGGMGAGIEEVLDLVARRPCTAEDVACALGMDLAETHKVLNALNAASRVRTSFLKSAWFYTAENPGPSQPAQ